MVKKQRIAGKPAPLGMDGLTRAERSGRVAPLAVELAAGGSTLERFRATYEKALTEQIKANPSKYAYGVERAPEMARRMTEALAAGGGDVQSATVKAAAKALGINPTVGGIKAALNDQPPPAPKPKADGLSAREMGAVQRAIKTGGAVNQSLVSKATNAQLQALDDVSRAARRAQTGNGNADWSKIKGIEDWRSAIQGAARQQTSNVVAQAPANAADADAVKQPSAPVAKPVRGAQHARLYVQQALSAPSVAETTSSLFGEETHTRSLIKERSAVLDRALTSLKSNRKLFGMLEREADTIEAAGNKLARQANSSNADTAGRLSALVEKLATQRGNVSKMLDDAARAVASGEPAAKAGRAFLKSVQGAMEQGGIRALVGDAPLPMAASGGMQRMVDKPIAVVRVEEAEGTRDVKRGRRTVKEQVKTYRAVREVDGFFEATVPTTVKGEAEYWASRLEVGQKPMGAQILRGTVDDVYRPGGAWDKARKDAASQSLMVEKPKKATAKTAARQVYREMSGSAPDPRWSAKELAKRIELRRVEIARSVAMGEHIDAMYGVKRQTSFLPPATTQEQVSAVIKSAGKPAVAQLPADDGLFGSSMKQMDLVDEARKTAYTPKTNAEIVAAAELSPTATVKMMGIPADGSKPFVMAILDTDGDKKAAAERNWKGNAHLYTQKLAGYELVDKSGNKLLGWSDAAREAAAEARGVAKPGEAKAKPKTQPMIGDKKLAVAAGMDAGNRSMRAAGRTQWNADDANAATEARAKVMGETKPKARAKTAPKAVKPGSVADLRAQAKAAKAPPVAQLRADAARAGIPAAAKPRVDVAAIAARVEGAIKSGDKALIHAVQAELAATKFSKADAQALASKTGVPVAASASGKKAMQMVVSRLAGMGQFLSKIKAVGGRGVSALGPAAIIGAGAVAFDATRNQAHAAGKSESAANLDAAGAAAIASGSVAAIGYGIGKVVQAAARVAPVAGKVLARAVPVVAVAAAGYEIGKGAVAGFKKDGLAGAAKGAGVGAMDFATLGAYSHFASKGQMGRLTPEQEAQFASADQGYRAGQEQQKAAATTDDGSGWTDQARIAAYMKRIANAGGTPQNMPYGGKPRQTPASSGTWAQANVAVPGGPAKGKN